MYNSNKNDFKLQTVIETEEFIQQAKHCMSDDVKFDFIDYISENPFAGDIIKGAGGARKIRWQSDRFSGKRAGVRVIYYYYDQDMPIYLFSAYKKNDKANLSETDKKMLYKIIKSIVHAYKGDE